MSRLADVTRIYEGSSGEDNRTLYAELEAKGPIGVLAVNLFRAQKNSERAKVYRGRRHRTAAYDTKQWAMMNLCTALLHDAAAAGIAWRWGVDDKQPVHRHVLYIDLPTGQVSFHTGARGQGPDYDGAWDAVPDQAVPRILHWVAAVLAGTSPVAPPAPARQIGLL